MSKRGYPYSLSESLASSRKNDKRRSSRLLKWLIMLTLLLGAGFAGLLATQPPESVTEYLPFPKRLIAFRFQLAGQEVILLPDSQVVVNPRDTVQLLQVQTDGWVSWGLKVTASEMDAAALRKSPVAVKEFFPQETFEVPKVVEFRALLWNRPIGKVSLLVQLDAKDWLHKANAAENPQQKIAYLEKALAENSSNTLVKTQLAGLYFENKKWEEAAKLYKEIDESGKSKSISERLLLVYQHMGRVDEALQVYLDLLKLDADEDVFKEFLQYLQKRKSKENAARFLEKHQKDIPQNFQSSLLLVIADLSSQTKNWSKAAASYERAIKSGIKSPDILYNLAVTYQQGDNPDKAAQALEAYLQKNPNDIKSWLQLAELQEKKGATSQAKATYKTVLQKSPQNKEALTRLIALLEKTNDKAELIATYEKMAQVQPKNKTIQHNLAHLHYQTKNWGKAADSFEALAAMDPKDVDSRKYLLDIYRKQNNDKGEHEMLRQLAQLDPKNTSYYDALFKSYDEKKDYKAIVALFKTATEQHSDSVQFHSYLLYGCLKVNDTNGALRELEHLSRLQPKEKKHLRQAADLYQTSGRPAEALKKLDQLLKLDPNNKELQDEYLRLRIETNKKKKS